MKKVAKAITSPATRLTAPATVALAARTARRRGLATKVVRISPVAYSELITSTPRVPKASCARPSPLKLSDTGSKVALAWAVMVAQWVTSEWVTRYPAATAATAAAARVR